VAKQALISNNSRIDAQAVHDSQHAAVQAVLMPAVVVVAVVVVLVRDCCSRRHNDVDVDAMDSVDAQSDTWANNTNPMIFAGLATPATIAV